MGLIDPVARRAIEACAYQRTTVGTVSVYEDWHWNLEMFAKGYSLSPRPIRPFITGENRIRCLRAWGCDRAFKRVLPPAALRQRLRMSSRAEKKRVRLLARRVVADLPAAQRGRWLVSFSRLYREALAARRAKRFGAKRRPFRIFPPAWRVKFAMVCHVLAVHRYKERDELLLAPWDDVGEVGTDVDQMSAAHRNG